MGGFNNPVVGALNLVRRAIRSPNYVPGSMGWSINQDGTVEFNTLGGTLQINNNGIFFYVPNAGVGNLRVSITTANGTDPYGNDYKAGLFINQEQIWATGSHSDTVMINPAGSLFPTVTWTAATFAEIARIYADGPNNKMILEATAAGAIVQVNAPFVATGGLQGTTTNQGTQPTFASTGAFVDYPSASWTPLSLTCPPSETIEIATRVAGYNSVSQSSTLSVAPRVKHGATTLVAPNFRNGINITSRITGSADNIGAFNRVVIGQDVLGGLAGQTITIVPAWSISSGGAGTANIGSANMYAVPCVFTQFTSSN